MDPAREWIRDRLDAVDRMIASLEPIDEIVEGGPLTYEQLQEFFREGMRWSC